MNERTVGATSQPTRKRSHTSMLRDLHAAFDDKAPRHMPLTARKSALRELFKAMDEAGETVSESVAAAVQPTETAAAVAAQPASATPARNRRPARRGLGFGRRPA